MLRAVRECPSNKAVWMEGLAELNGVRTVGTDSVPPSHGVHAVICPPSSFIYLPISHCHTRTRSPNPPQAIPPREVSDLLEVAADKGLRLRTDKVEAMLQELDEREA